MVYPTDFVHVELSFWGWDSAWEDVRQIKEDILTRKLKNARGLNLSSKESLDLTNKIVAEEVVREYLNIPYTKVSFENRIELGDIPSLNADVKCVSKLYHFDNPMSLIISPQHLRPKRRYILVLWENEASQLFKIVGWDTADNIKTFPTKDPKNKDGTPRNSPAYFVPWPSLQPFHLFKNSA